MENETESQSLSSIEVMPTSVLESITRGEIDIQIATAHKYPRSLDVYKKRAIAMATIDIETAESCLYARPVGGGKVAEGMSVRMAEIVGACYGNLRVGAIILEITDTQVKARGVAHDLETNFASSSDIIESCLKSDGKTPYDARMRVTVAKAAVAKARRDATFQVVPKALARPIERAVRALLADEKIQTFTERRDAVLKWITERLKIEPARVWALLGVKGQDDLQQEHLDLLAGLKTALKDGEVTIDEAFPAQLAKKPIFPDRKPDKAPADTETPASTAPSTAEKPADSAKAPEKTKEPSTSAKPPALPKETPKEAAPADFVPMSEEGLEPAICAIVELANRDKITFKELYAVLRKLNKIPRSAEDLSSLSEANGQWLYDGWDGIVVDIIAARGKK
jgi:hypothetical protein